MEQKVKVAMLPVGKSKIELLEATDSGIAKFIASRGEGIHHIGKSLEVTKNAGIKFIDSFRIRRGLI